jgi:hypothetical protein
LDWLIPYATRAKPWPHEQIAEMGAGRMLALLRRAGRASHEPGYERVIETLIRRGERPAEEWVLLHPAGRLE